MGKIIQQEILLITGTYFSSRQCWQNINNDNKHISSESDQLQDACWNGLLNEMLPELFGPAQNLFLWQIRENKSGIEIEIGELPIEVEPYFSIDPYSFQDGQNMN